MNDREYRYWLTRRVSDTLKEVLGILNAKMAVIEPLADGDTVRVVTDRGEDFLPRDKHKVIDFLATLVQNLRAKRIVVGEEGFLITW